MGRANGRELRVGKATGQRQVVRKVISANLGKSGKVALELSLRLVRTWKCGHGGRNLPRRSSLGQGM